MNKSIDPKNKRIRFESDRLVQQIIDGRKTASADNLKDIERDVDDYNSALVIGHYYDVYDSRLVNRTTIRITGLELCRWDSIPERLWRGETNSSAEEFRQDHHEFFNHPADDFEFAAFYFEIAKNIKNNT